MEPNSEIPQPERSNLDKKLSLVRTRVDEMIAKIPPSWRKKILPAALGGTMAFMAACGGGQPAEKPDIQPTPIVVPGTPEPTPRVIHVNVGQGTSHTEGVVVVGTVTPEGNEVTAPITGHIEADPHMPDYDEVVLALPNEILQQIELNSPEGTEVSIGFSIDSDQDIKSIQLPIGDWLGGEFAGIKISPTDVINLQNPDGMASYLEELFKSQGYVLDNWELLKKIKLEYGVYSDQQRMQLTFPSAWMGGQKAGKSPVLLNVARGFWNKPSLYIDKTAGVSDFAYFVISTSDEKFKTVMMPTVELEK